MREADLIVCLSFFITKKDSRRLDWAWLGFGSGAFLDDFQRDGVPSRTACKVFRAGVLFAFGALSRFSYDSLVTRAIWRYSHRRLDRPAHFSSELRLGMGKVNFGAYI